MSVVKDYKIERINWKTNRFIFKREVVEFSKLKDFFAKAYNELYSTAQRLRLKNNYPYAIYHNVDEQKGKTEVSAAISINSIGMDNEKGLDILTIPECQGLLLTYYGPYENMHEAYTLLEQYLAKNKLNKQWVLEEYRSDPEQEKDPSKWQTNIYYLLK